MEPNRHPRRIAAGLAALFTGLDVGIQIGPNGEPNFVAGTRAQMVLPVAFELDPVARR